MTTHVLKNTAQQTLVVVNNKTTTVHIRPRLDLYERLEARRFLARLGIHVNDQYEATKPTGFTIQIDSSLTRAA